MYQHNRVMVDRRPNLKGESKLKEHTVRQWLQEQTEVQNRSPKYRLKIDTEIDDQNKGSKTEVHTEINRIE